MTTATHIRPVSLDALPEYPVAADVRRMAELRRLEFGPLRNWTPCRCGRAIGLSWWTAKRIVAAARKARAAGGAA